MAIYSVDIHGNEYVKVHSVSDISTTQGAKNKGCRIVPGDNNVTLIKIVSGKYEPDLAILMPGKNKTSSEKGTPITTVSQQEKNAINLLATIKD